MVVITVENYMNARVHTIAQGKRELLQVKMLDVPKGLGLKNISDLIRKEIQGIYETNCPTKEQINKYKRSEAELDLKNSYSSSLIKYVRSDLMEKIIKNCRGVKRCNDGINRMQKEQERQDFRIIWGFKQNDIYKRKEYSVLKKIKKGFPNDIINDQYKVDKYFIDLVFPVHKLGIEVDENNHIIDTKLRKRRENK